MNILIGLVVRSSFQAKKKDFHENYYNPLFTDIFDKKLMIMIYDSWLPEHFLVTAQFAAIYMLSCFVPPDSFLLTTHFLPGVADVLPRIKINVAILTNSLGRH